MGRRVCWRLILSLLLSSFDFFSLSVSPFGTGWFLDFPFLSFPHSLHFLLLSLSLSLSLSFSFAPSFALPLVRSLSSSPSLSLSPALAVASAGSVCPRRCGSLDWLPRLRVLAREGRDCREALCTCRSSGFFVFLLFLRPLLLFAAGGLLT